MATMNISLPDEMKDWVEERAVSSHFSNVSEYVRDVLRREQAAIERLQSVIDEARASGLVEMTPEQLLEDIKRSNREKILDMAAAIKTEAVKADDAA